MRCPACRAEDTKVIDSRILNEGLSVRRRRKCEICANRFTTYEHVEIPLPSILKRDGRREQYSREKVLRGLQKALQKRPVPVETIDSIIDGLENYLQQHQQKEVEASDIGTYIMEALRKIDPVAFVRYASFYWDYENVDGFLNVLKNSSSEKKVIKEKSSQHQEEIHEH